MITLTIRLSCRIATGSQKFDRVSLLEVPFVLRRCGRDVRTSRSRLPRTTMRGRLPPDVGGRSRPGAVLICHERKRRLAVAQRHSKRLVGTPGARKNPFLEDPPYSPIDCLISRAFPSNVRPGPRTISPVWTTPKGLVANRHAIPLANSQCACRRLL